MSGPVTSRPFNRSEWRRESKRLFAAGCATLPGVDYPDVAAALDENVSTVKAWGSPNRDHSIPEWAMVRLRQVLPTLALYIDDGMRRFTERAPAPGETESATAKTIEACCLGSATLIAVLPGGVAPHEARGALPLLYEQAATIQKTIRLYEGLARSDEPGAERGVQ